MESWRFCTDGPVAPIVAQILLGKHGLVDDQLQTLVDYGFGRNAALPVSSLDLRCNKLSPFAGPALKQLISFTSTLQV